MRGDMDYLVYLVLVIARFLQGAALCDGAPG